VVPLFCFHGGGTGVEAADGKIPMNGELLRQVDAIRREKNIDAEIVFQGI
jgi:hypothetical protein